MPTLPCSKPPRIASFPTLFSVILLGLAACENATPPATAPAGTGAARMPSGTGGIGPSDARGAAGAGGGGMGGGGIGGGRMGGGGAGGDVDATVAPAALDASVADTAPDRAPGLDGPTPLDGAADQQAGNLALGARCEAPGGILGGCQPDLLCCKPCCDGRPAVCTRPVQNAAGIGVGLCPLPDLTVSVNVLRTSVGAGPITFTPQTCAVQEKCVAAPGVRQTLHFEMNTPNIGTADLMLGDPARMKDQFVFAACHGHYHFDGYALYQLFNPQGQEVIQGSKQAFCLMDTDKVSGYPLQRPRTPLYDCDHQGISRGWYDSYENGLECQYIDITGLAPGRYTLRATVNPGRSFRELRYDNNSADYVIDLPAPPDNPVGPCLGKVPGIERECGWTAAQHTCTPGARITIGCGAGCGGGTSTGDAMMRVCAGDAPCRHPGLANNDDCPDGNGARVRTTCPASGRITVMTGSLFSDEASTCEYVIQ